MGPDNLHPCLLKHCTDSLAYPILYLIKKSFHTCILPLLWKTSYMFPNFGKGLCFSPLNCRPESLSCKCFERIFTWDNSLLSQHQSGFRAGHSGEAQLLLTYHFLLRWGIQGWSDSFFFISLRLPLSSTWCSVGRAVTTGFCTGQQYENTCPHKQKEVNSIFFLLISNLIADFFYIRHSFSVTAYY